MPINSSEIVFVAANVFAEILIRDGEVTEDQAKAAKEAFYAMKKDHVEETQMKITRIASRVSMNNS